jgi:putative oxidoreductase
MDLRKGKNTFFAWPLWPEEGFPPMIDSKLAPYGAFVLRAALGVMFIAHAYLKLSVFTVPGFEGFLTKIGYPAALAWPIILAELIGGLAILVGFYGRWVQIALLPVLVGALLVHLPNGWFFSAPNGGWEYPAFLVAAAVAHIFAGDGAFAIRPASLTLSSLQEPVSVTA